MSGSIKKVSLEQHQISAPLLDPSPCTCTWRRPPSTPPIPIRSLKLVTKQPEIPVVLRERRKVKGPVSGVRESWPRVGPMISEPKLGTTQRSLTPPPWSQPIIKSWPRTTNQPQPYMTQSAPSPALSQNPQLPAAPHPHWFVPFKSSHSGRGSETTLMSLLLFCHSNSSLIAIDNKIEQAMDLVKSHLMLAVREEVELLREQIRELQEKNQQLERENHILRTLTHNTHAT